MDSISDVAEKLLLLASGAVIAVAAEPPNPLRVSPVEPTFGGPLAAASDPNFNGLRTVVPGGARYGGFSDAGPWTAGVVRVSLVNEGRSSLADCQPFIINVEREEPGGWQRTAFLDPLRLPWSATRDDTRWAARDLPRGVTFFTDVLSVFRSNDPAGDTLKLTDDFGIVRLGNLLASKGRYRLTIAVTGNRIPPKRLKVTVDWRGQWETIKAERAD